MMPDGHKMAVLPHRKPASGSEEYTGYQCTARPAPLTPGGQVNMKEWGLDFSTKVKVSISSPSCALNQ